MGGTVLDYPTKTAYREGIAEGKAEGIAEGIAEGKAEAWNLAIEKYIKAEMNSGLTREEAEAKAMLIFGNGEDD